MYIGYCNDAINERTQMRNINYVKDEMKWQIFYVKRLKYRYKNAPKDWKFRKEFILHFRNELPKLIRAINNPKYIYILK